MKFAISAAALILVLGTGTSAYARQDNGHEDHSQTGRQQESKPAQTQAKPEHQEARPAQHQEHSQQQARPAQQHAQAQGRPEQQHAQQHTVSRQQSHASNQNHGNYAHGRISDAHYASNFGSGHRFHVNQGEYRNRRFQYGGYSFGFVDAWPAGWGYSDDVYVVYSDDGYYMYDRVHPGARITLSIF